MRIKPLTALSEDECAPGAVNYAANQNTLHCKTLA